MEDFNGRRYFLVKLSAPSVPLLLGSPWLASAANAQSADIGTPERIQGEVHRVGGTGRQTLQLGQALQEGDRITTSAASEAVVKFVDGSVLALRPQSEVSLAQYKFNQQAPAQQAVWLQLARGGLRVVTGLIAKTNPSSVRFTTATATVGIRGTEFELTQVDPPAQPANPNNQPPTSPPSAPPSSQPQPGTYTRVYAGATTLQSTENNREIQVEAGQSAFAPNLAVALAVTGTVIQELGLLRNTPAGVFFNGRFDGTLQSLSNTVVNQLQQRINQQMPSELRQIIPGLGNIFRR